MTKAEASRIERVCVALDAAFSATETLSLAASLAQELDAELAGLFVEDENVLRAAALSFTCELGAASGRSMPMELVAIERAFRAQALALKSALAQIAEQLRLRWSFVTLRGAGVAPVIDAASAMSLMVMAPRTISLLARTRRDQVSRVSGPQNACIAVVCGDAGEALDVVGLAAPIARSRSAPLAFMMATGADSASDVNQYVKDRLAGEAPAMRYIPMNGVSVENAAAAARGARAALLIAPFRVAVALDLAELLRRLPCPLVLVK